MAEDKTQRKSLSLTELIGARRVEGDVPPIITVGRIPIQVLKSIRDMDAPIDIEGVPSDSSDVMPDGFDEAFTREMKRAVNEHGRE